MGHAVGRRDPAGARHAGWVALGIGAGFMCVAALAFVSLPRPILRIFSTDSGVIETGVLLLLVAAESRFVRRVPVVLARAQFARRTWLVAAVR